MILTIHGSPYGQECQYTFTIFRSILKTCFWAGPKFHSSMALRFKIKIQQPPLAVQPPIKLSPHIYNTHPYTIKNTRQQRFLFNPHWSLKRVDLALRINVSTIKSDCSAFLGVAHTGWLAWMTFKTILTYTGYTIPDYWVQD